MVLIFSFFREIQKSSPFGFRLQQIVSSDLNTHTNKKRQINQTLQCKLCKKRKAERQNTISVVQSFSLKVEKKDFFQCFSSILQPLQFQLLSLELKKNSRIGSLYEFFKVNEEKGGSWKNELSKINCKSSKDKLLSKSLLVTYN